MSAVRSLGGLASQIRSKNAGPFWVTVDMFFETRPAFEAVAADGVLTPDIVSALYRVPAESVAIFRIPSLLVIKVSFPRAHAQGSITDGDMHAAHQYIPLASVAV